ncbi:SseB protein N-terminal domain-containing protein [Cognatiyoonia koreensis]|uniref:SseB protein N-terminal domain-containing protein n=1 Tax=Cognatiyoonia koreensis TaxID=364200 RepID=A0A1I0MTM8_9RHOB|nr:SseB family protein [Cognatiyoonia koreensis]SEV91670.1 SseB protein N-terminal domain-containing protein [Cognatiyoonia koreensis]
MTDLDTAHAAMEAAPDDDALRLRFYERLADSELFMLLGADPVDDKIEPSLFDIEDRKFALVFDREERLADFVGRAAPYAGLPGRALVQMLTGQGIGLAFNLEVAPSAMLIPTEAVDWLAAILQHAPDETEARLQEIAAPTGLPEAVITGLDRKLAIAAGLAKWAYLAAATYDGGMKGHVLAFVDAQEGAEKALANAAGEALTFSGIEAGTMDVLFCRSSDPLAARLAKVGLRFDLPEPVKARPMPIAPGSDPDKPPKLR